MPYPTTVEGKVFCAVFVGTAALAFAGIVLVFSIVADVWRWSKRRRQHQWTRQFDRWYRRESERLDREYADKCKRR